MGTADTMISGNLLNKKDLRKLVLIIVLMIAIIINRLCTNKQNGVYYEIISVHNLNQKGWGYEIYIDDNLYIRQTEIPCIQGVQPFHTYGDAEIIAQKVKDKIRKQVLPVITKTDLIESNILIHEFY